MNEKQGVLSLVFKSNNNIYMILPRQSHDSDTTLLTCQTKKSINPDQYYDCVGSQLNILPETPHHQRVTRIVLYVFIFWFVVLCVFV